MDAPLSLYLHIPFCIHRCAYCDFNTYANQEERIPGYVEALCKEIKIVGSSAQRFQGEKPEVHSVFFGGGTPSLLNLAQLTQIFSAISSAFVLSPDMEFTLEANPGTVDLEKLQGIFSLGINRLSLGMQSASPEDLRVLERQHSLEDVVQAVHWSRQAGFKNINLDLIFGLPHQSLVSWQNTLSKALSLNPEHLSLYALTLEHGTPMENWVARGLIPEPDPDLAADMYEYSMEVLDKSGFGQYEISNWARRDPSGRLQTCRHNLQYWRSLPYLGIGAGAHGFAAGFRNSNVLSPQAYIQRLQYPEQAEFVFPRSPATAEWIPIDRQAAIGEFMMMGLRLVQEGISEVTFERRFGSSLEQTFAPQIKKLILAGLLEWSEVLPGKRLLRLTRSGRLLGNRVFREFI